MTARLAVAAAAELARRAHADQRDKAGRPYIRHPESVAAIVRGRFPDDEVAEIVAWLHDVVEDTGVTLDQIRAEFGDDVADGVDAMSRRPGEDPDQYYARVAANQTARRVKRADLTDNTDPERRALLPPDLQQRLLGKYRHAIEELGWGPDVPEWGAEYES